MIADRDECASSSEIGKAIRTLPCANILGLDSRLGRSDGGPERSVIGFRLRLDRILFSAWIRCQITSILGIGDLGEERQEGVSDLLRILRVGVVARVIDHRVPAQTGWE